MSIHYIMLLKKSIKNEKCIDIQKKRIFFVSKIHFFDYDLLRMNLCLCDRMSMN